jgi:hypothetical protein
MPTTDSAKPDWVRRVLGIEPATPGGPLNLAGWRQARGAAVTSLNALADAVAKLDIPEAREATILLRAVRANLTEAPTTARQIAELRRYLETDDVIEEAEHPNGFGITVSLREPLLAALDGLASQLPRTSPAHVS